MASLLPWRALSHFENPEEHVLTHITHRYEKEFDGVQDVFELQVCLPYRYAPTEATCIDAVPEADIVASEI